MAMCCKATDSTVTCVLLFRDNQGCMPRGDREIVQGHHVRRVHKDTRMKSHGCEKGPIKNVHVLGPEFCATL